MSCKPLQHSQHRFSVSFGQDHLFSLVKSCTPPALRGVDEAFKIRAGRQRLGDRADQRGGKNIQIAHWSEGVSDPSQLLRGPAVMLFLQRSLQSQKRGAKTPDRYSHLVDAFRLTRQRGLFVAQKVGEAASPDALQRGLDARGRIERDGSHTDCLRHQPIGSKQSITSFGLAARLNADWRSFEKLQRRVEDHPRIAILELELDFADRLDGIALGSADLALVNGRLDPSGWTRADFDHRSRDCRREDWTQLLTADSVRQPLARLRCIKNRPLARDLVLPLFPLQYIRLSGILGLDSLYELGALLAHPKR